MQQKPEELFQPIISLPLTRTTRNGQVQYFHFGSTHYTTSQGLVLDIGAYTLALDCPWQLELPQGEAITHRQIFLQKQAAGLPDPTFDWKVPGSNMRDQRLKDLLKGGYPMVAEKAEPGENFGFKLYFTNGAMLSVTPTPADKGEFFWQIFSNLGDGFKAEAGPAGLIR
ncbi:hypothetical protein [Pontibacter beigongshangensis]|uniref:hypothetical protein n=1 Tax=Pontibacter beigongshangensis TaxID=2574733 RepID=UPI00164FB5C2|nr:hypothetical protein [Pontibacter beigongshangensis]